MDTLPISEILPGLYRAVLDAVAELEARHRRADAALIRTEGTRVYSGAWNADAARRLKALRIRADRIGEGRPRSRYEMVIEALRPKVDVERRPKVDLERRTA